MKKIFAIAVCAAVALPFSVSVGFADPGKGPATDAVGFCKDLTDAGISKSIGECMGILRADDAPGFCKFLDAVGFLDYYGLNRGNCVSYIRHLQH
jgi:hypothetical protein